MGKEPADPNALKALNQMKYEIANELGIIDDKEANRGTLNSGKSICFAGHVGGQMTKRMVEMAEKSLINQGK